MRIMIGTIIRLLRSYLGITAVRWNGNRGPSRQSNRRALANQTPPFRTKKNRTEKLLVIILDGEAYLAPSKVEKSIPQNKKNPYLKSSRSYLKNRDPYLKYGNPYLENQNFVEFFTVTWARTIRVPDWFVIEHSFIWLAHWLEVPLSMFWDHSLARHYFFNIWLARSDFPRYDWLKNSPWLNLLSTSLHDRWLDGTELIWSMIG